MSKILVSGSIAYDRIMDFPGYFKDHFLPDKLHNISVSFNVETVSENFGGTAGNIAYNLMLLGHEPKIISTGGSDFEKYRAYLETQKIDYASIQIEPSKLTSFAYVVTDKANNQIAAFSMGAGASPYQPLPATDDVSCAIIGAGCVRDMQALTEHYRTSGLQYMYDPGQAIPALSVDDVRRGITGAAVIFANDYEFGLISFKTGWSEAQLLEQTPVVVITYGANGSRVITKEGAYKIEPSKVTEDKDPTGAGDAYRAGFIAGFVKGLRPEQCARIGSTVAAYAVETYGTQNHRFTKEELAKRYKDTYAEVFPI